jgi:hypothetical protein
MRRLSICSNSSDCGVKSSKWIHSFHRKVGPQGDSSATIDEGSESVQAFYPFWALQIRRVNGTVSAGKVESTRWRLTMRSCAYHISLVLHSRSSMRETVKDGSTHTCVGCTLAITTNSDSLRCNETEDAQSSAYRRAFLRAPCRPWSRSEHVRVVAAGQTHYRPPTRPQRHREQ